MKLTSKLLNKLMIGGLALSIVLFFVIMFMGLSVLSSKSRQLVDLKVQSETADARLTNLLQAKKDVEKYSYFKKVARTVVPNDKDQAQAVFELNQMARKAGFRLQSITFPSSTLGGTAGAGTGSAAPGLSTSSVAAISQAKPVSGIAGLYSLELIVTSDTSKTLPPQEICTYPKVLDFLSQIEKNRRTAQISNISIQPASNSAALSFSLTINIFIRP